MTFGTMYEQGNLVLVPFPFTDLTNTKQRPAIIISPNWFNTTQEDLVLVAITASIPGLLNKDLEISLSQTDIQSGRLPKKSVIKIAKIFTCHKSIIIKQIALINKNKLREILKKLKSFLK